MNPISQEKVDTNNIHETFCFMVLEDFLMKRQMPESLAAFRKEWSRPSENIAMMSWYEVALKLRLPEMMARGSERAPVLENMVTALVQESSIRCRKSPELVLAGLATAPKLLNTENVDSSFDYHTNRLNNIYNRTFESTFPRPKTNESKNANQASPTRAKNPRKLRHHLTGESQAIIQKQLDLIAADRFGKGKPSSENWIPEIVRHKSIEREIGVINKSIQDFSVLQTSQQRQMREMSMSAVERAKVEKELGTTKEMPCGCCLHKFLYVNLPLKVSQKAILDIRAKWSGALNSTSVFGKKSEENEDNTSEEAGKEDGSHESVLVMLNPKTGKKELTGDGFARLHEKRYGAVPRCYDEVPVCLFCSQFFEQPEKYRPSFQTIYYEERKAAHFEKRRREKEYWDPLKMLEKYRAAEEAEAEAKLQEQREEELAKQQQVESNNVNNDNNEGNVDYTENVSMT